MDKILIIGIDGGATKVSAWETKFNNKSGTFSLGEYNAQKKYGEIPGYLEKFQPTNIAIQLKERDSDSINQSNDEKQQETVYVEACAAVIEEVTKITETNDILIGIGMPGLKTANKRGIAVVANGPRMINYCDLLERRLKAANINLVAPVHHLGSDADYCGIGENHATDGLFKPYANAYYLGGGTGVADALKIKNQLLPFDATKEWIAKTWELQGSDNKSLEKFCSASGIQSLYAELAEKDVNDLNHKGIFPPQIAELANKNDNAAVTTFKKLVENVANLLYSRITTLYSGWQNVFTFVNPNRPQLNTKHKYLTTLFDKIIIGQRLGDLYNMDIAKDIFKIPLLTLLNDLLQNSTVLPGDAKKHYAQLDNIIAVSKLREAPALGAGIDAFFSWQDFQ